MTRVPKRKRKPRLWPWVLAALILAVSFYRSNFTFALESFTFADPRLPAAFDGLRIVQLTDLHGRTFGEDNADLIAAVAEAEPDIIVLTGDLQDAPKETPPAYTWQLGAAMAAIAPTYFVTGNHEWALGDVPELKAGLEAAGVTVLSNEYTVLERGGDRLILAGIDDPNGYADQKTPEELAEEIRLAEGEDACWLLLAHRNNLFPDEYSALGADLVLSGHGHGGMIRLPFTDGLIGVDRTLFPSYTNGFYGADGADVFVSRGLGSSGRSFRLFNRPQVAVLTLTRG